MIVVCLAELQCKTCDDAVDQCTTCDTAVRYLQERDSKCVLRDECDDAMPLFWDTTDQLCKCKQTV